MSIDETLAAMKETDLRSFSSIADLMKDLKEMELPEKLARAVLLFFQDNEWGTAEQATWKELTGEDEATTKVLCDLARKVVVVTVKG